MFLMIFNFSNRSDLLLLRYYCNDNCDVGSHKKTQNYLGWHDITLYLLFVLYKGLMMD